MASAPLTGERLEKFHALYTALLNHLLERFRSPGEVDTALMRVTVAFLADNGINAQSLSDARNALSRLSALAQSFADLPDDPTDF